MKKTPVSVIGQMSWSVMYLISVRWGEVLSVACLDASQLIKNYQLHDKMASVSSDLATTVSAEEGSRIVFHPPLLRTHPGHAIPYITLTMMAIVLGIVGNILILVVFSKYKKLDRNGNEFMINLAIADLFVTAIADPMCIVGE